MTGGPASTVRVSARLRLALSYAVFLVAAGAVVLLGVYVVLRYVPNYPLTAANPQDAGTFVATRQQILSALVGVSAIALVGLAIIGIVGGWFLAGWVLKPLRRINEAAVIVASGDLRHRIRLGGRNDEFRQLADAFDHMLARLHEAFEVQERFAANASHELRTPLAVTATTRGSSSGCESRTTAPSNSRRRCSASPTRTRSAPSRRKSTSPTFSARRSRTRPGKPSDGR
jgi:two-component system sensor histidine kinase VanS